MDKLYKSAIEEKNKISLNLDKRTLKLIEDLAKLTKSNKTMIIEALLYKGSGALMGEMRTTWKALLIKGNPADKKKLKKLLSNLDKIEKKWNYDLNKI